MKQKHTISVSEEQWNLAKESGINVSQLVEETVSLRCGSIKKVIEASSFCFGCKSKIKIGEVVIDFTPMENQLWIFSRCKGCSDKIKIHRIKTNQQDKETEVTHTFFSEFMKDINDNAEAQKLLNVIEPGLVVVSSRDKLLGILKK